MTDNWGSVYTAVIVVVFFLGVYTLLIAATLGYGRRKGRSYRGGLRLKPLAEIYEIPAYRADLPMPRIGDMVLAIASAGILEKEDGSAPTPGEVLAYSPTGECTLWYTWYPVAVGVLNRRAAAKKEDRTQAEAEARGEA